MYVVFEGEEPHTFLLVLKLSSTEHKSSLQGYVVQMDSNLVVIILYTFFLSVGTKSGCLRIQPRADVLEIFVRWLLVSMSIQFRNQLGHSVVPSRVTVPKDGCGGKQQGSSNSETILLLSLSAFPVPQNH